MAKLDKRDQELLDKLVWGVSSAPRQNHNGLINGVTILAVFLAGIAIGDILFAQQGNPVQNTYDRMAALSSSNDAQPIIPSISGAADPSIIVLGVSLSAAVSLSGGI